MWFLTNQSLKITVIINYCIYIIYINKSAKAYNIKAEELNKLETTKLKYDLNNLEL